MKDSSFSPSLCLGSIGDIKDFLFHCLLLIARHYMYTCKLGNALPQIIIILFYYIQLLKNSMELEKQIAFDKATPQTPCKRSGPALRKTPHKMR